MQASRPFHPEFDVIAVLLAVASLLILLFFGLSQPEFFKSYWVAFAFWLVGFPASMMMGLVQMEKALNIKRIMIIFLGAGFIILVFTGLNLGYAQSQPQDLWLSDKLVSFSVGVCEELFFGVFLLGLLINFAHFHPLLAIGISAAAHSVYHVPNLGSDPKLLTLFFLGFFIARCVYVYLYQKVGVLALAHGAWNLWVT